MWYSYVPATIEYNWKVISLFSVVYYRKRACETDDNTFLNVISGNLIVVRLNKWHFLNSETKLGKTDMFLEMIAFEIWPYLEWPWPFLGSNLKMNVTTELCIRNGLQNICYATLMNHFHLASLLALALTLTFIYHKASTYMIPSSSQNWGPVLLFVPS